MDMQKSFDLSLEEVKLNSVRSTPDLFRSVSELRVREVQSERRPDYPNNESCSNCKKSTAARVCACTSPPTLLCNECLSSHESKTLFKLHITFPLQTLDAFSRIKNFSKVLNRRKKGIAQAIENIKSENFPKFEEALKMVNQECEKIIDAVKRYQTSLEQRLNSLKATFESEVEKAITEVGQALYQAELQSAPEPVWSIWNFSKTEPKPKFPYVKVVKNNSAQIIKAIESLFEISLDIPKGNKPIPRKGISCEKFSAPVNPSRFTVDRKS